MLTGEVVYEKNNRINDHVSAIIFRASCHYYVS